MITETDILFLTNSQGAEPPLALVLLSLLLHCRIRWIGNAGGYILGLRGPRLDPARRLVFGRHLKGKLEI